MSPLVVAAPAKSDAAAPSSPADPWADCPFPPEADAARINYGVVQLVASIDADGKVQDVKVIADPGNGFGRAAQLCVLRYRWNPATDHDGHPKATTQRIDVKFKR
jgi:protein TonB